MILHLSFEELRAIASAGELIVADEGHASPGVAAPPEWAGRMEQLLARLTGDISIESLDEQRRLRETLGRIVGEMHRRLDRQVLETFPAHEESVSLYFDWAYARSVLERLDRMGAEMEAIADLISGGDRSAMFFPD